MKRASTLSELTQQNVETITKIERESESQRTFAERVADGDAEVIGDGGDVEQRRQRWRHR